MAEGVNKFRWEQKDWAQGRPCRDYICPESCGEKLIHTTSVSEPEQVQMPRNGLSVLENRAALVAGWSAGREVQARRPEANSAIRLGLLLLFPCAAHWSCEAGALRSHVGEAPASIGST